MKNKTFIDSIRCALRGIAAAVCSEKNFRYYLVIDLIFLGLDLWWRVDRITWLLYILTSLSVYAMECVNTAIERLCDYQTQETVPLIGTVKDMAAGAVLVCGVGFFTVQIFAFVQWLS
ncbi:MAG: diacylglycerol kinase [Lachnospiraceae bacterium]|nr:diacylglycerol kinase [Lachnospiraceae bacterium]MDY5742677.1 diacylglycerol kinase [Lachnospiraceae bacterium]